jgi:2'-5' RNA ligase
VHDVIPKQATLGGFASPQPSDRLFLAVQPDVGATKRIVALARRLREEHGARGRPLDEPRLHVTLQYFGAFAGLPQGLVAAIEHVVDDIDLRAFEIAFDHIASFDGGARRRPWVLRGSEEGLARLHELHAVLGAGLAAAGVRVEGHARFLPHLTLLYEDRPLPRQAIDPIAWAVRELVLVDSLVGQGEHRVLRRWPLRAEPGVSHG